MSSFTAESINLDISYKCTLQCPFCERQNKDFKDYKGLMKDMSLEQFKKIANSNQHIGFCGQVSDPIFNVNFIEILKYSYANKNIISVNTAANHSKQSWYKEAFKANPDALWCFGIDGLPSKDNPHRINQKSMLLFNTMMLGKSMGIECQWQCIIFSFNEKDVEKIQELAKQIGVSLRLILSNRFNDDTLRPRKGLYVEKYHDTKKEGELRPKCLPKAELGNSAMGYLLPCCWLAEGNVEKKYPFLCNENTHLDNINSVEELLDTKEYKNFYKLLTTTPQKAPDKCWEKCSSKSGEHKKYIYLHEGVGSV